ncbi:MAG: DUF222 domain-containing protein [Kineosporiaceae bacterium]
MEQEQTPLPDGAVGAGPLPAVLAALVRVGADVGLLQGASTLCLSDVEHGDALATVFGLRARLEAAYLHLLRSFDSRPDAVPGAASGTVGATYLIHTCNADPGQARLDARAAHAVDGDGAGVVPATAAAAPTSSTGLPRVGAALASGQTSRAHLNAALGALKKIPAHLLNEVDADGWSGAARVDAFLAEQATVLSARDLARLTKQLLATLDPDGKDSYDPDACTRRELSFHTDATGMLVGRFALDAASGALVRAAIDALVKQGMTRPEPGESPDPQPALALPDERTPAQRRADALTDLARTYLCGPREDGPDAQAATKGQTGRNGGARTPTTQVHIWATAAQIAAARAAQPNALDAQGRPIHPPGASFVRPFGPTAPGLATDLATGEPLDPGTFSRLLCDAVLDPTLFDDNGAALAHGRTTRLATAAQRRALITRDRGCVVPGCAAPISWCDAHHVVWWRHNGPTDIDNLAMLCGRHHTAVHSGHWALQMIDGVPWAVPPRSIDPTQNPRRNTLWHREHRARQLGQHLRNRQLRLDLPEEAPAVEPTGSSPPPTC